MKSPTTLYSKKKSKTPWHLVLDMDETLLHTFDSIKDFYKLDLFHPKNLHHLPLRKNVYHIEIPQSDGTVDEYWGAYRPHVHDFLKFSLDFFETVTIWSAGTTEYVYSIIQKLFQELGDPHAVFTRPDCVYHKEGYLMKPLMRIPEMEPKKYSTLNLTNSFIIDDRDTAYLDTNPHNGIMIPIYEPRPTIEGMMKDDQALVQLMHWFQLMEQRHGHTDIRPFKKEKVFIRPVQSYRSEIKLLKKNRKYM